MSNEKISVFYSTRNLTQTQVTVAEFDLVQSLYKDGKTVAAIKFVRSQYGFSLAEAKWTCDAIAKNCTSSISALDLNCYMAFN